jgi:hypothetical protein
MLKYNPLKMYQLKKYKRMKKSNLLSIFLLISSITFAQFSIDGQFRTRYEYRNGYMTLPVENSLPNNLIGQRSRIIFNYKTDKLTTKLSFQDTRIWGQSQFKTNNNSIGIFEAWIKYYFTNNLGIKVGRQVVKYDDQRLFCTGDWRTYGEAIDVIIVQYHNKDIGFKADFGFGLNNNGDIETNPWQSSYDLRTTQSKNLTYLWLNKTALDNKLNLSLMTVMDGNQKADIIDTAGNVITFPDKIMYRFTVGPYIKYKNNKFSVEGAFYYQTGKDPKNNDINAMFYSTKINYQLMKKFGLFAGYDHYSGTDYSDPYNTENSTFSNLFGPGHKYLGYMDFFGKPQKHGSGINDLFFGLTTIPFKGYKTYTAIHIFSLDKGYLKSGTKVDKYLGTELDIVISKKISKLVSLNLGYSTMFATGSMEQLKGITPGKSTFPGFAWIMLNIQPNFFTSKN